MYKQVNIFPFPIWAQELYNLLTECRKRQQIRPNRARTALIVVFDYCFLVLFSFFIFTT